MVVPGWPDEWCSPTIPSASELADARALRAGDGGESGDAETVGPTHPAVAFYEGAAPVALNGGHRAMGCIELHCTLLPPGGEEGGAADGAMTSAATPEAVRLWEENWPRLHGLLLPCFAPPVPESAEADEAHPLPPLSVLTWVKIRAAAPVMDRVFYSYCALLRFYGWRMHCEDTGEVDRCANWRERYAALERQHCAAAAEGNAACSYYAWLGRTLRFQLELGFTRMAVRLVIFLFEEITAARLQFLEDVLQRCWAPIVRASALADTNALAAAQRRCERRHESDSE